MKLFGERVNYKIKYQRRVGAYGIILQKNDLILTEQITKDNIGLGALIPASANSINIDLKQNGKINKSKKKILSFFSKRSDIVKDTPLNIEKYDTKKYYLNLAEEIFMLPFRAICSN